MRVPHISHQRRPAHRHARVTNQPSQQIELLRPQHQLRRSQPRPTRRLIDHQITHNVARRRVVARSRSAQVRPQPSKQLRRADRLGQIVIRSGLQPDNDVDLRIAGGQDHDHCLGSR